MKYLNIIIALLFFLAAAPIRYWGMACACPSGCQLCRLYSCAGAEAFPPEAPEFFEDGSVRDTGREKRLCRCDNSRELNLRNENRSISGSAYTAVEPDAMVEIEYLCGLPPSNRLSPSRVIPEPPEEPPRFRC